MYIAVVCDIPVQLYEAIIKINVQVLLYTVFLKGPARNACRLSP